LSMAFVFSHNAQNLGAIVGVEIRSASGPSNLNSFRGDHAEFYSESFCAPG
jgi:hypothetical protein